MNIPIVWTFHAKVVSIYASKICYHIFKYLGFSDDLPT